MFYFYVMGIGSTCQCRGTGCSRSGCLFAASNCYQVCGQMFRTSCKRVMTPWFCSCLWHQARFVRQRKAKSPWRSFQLYQIRWSMRKPFYGGMCSSFGGWHGCGLWWGISKMRSSSTSQICGFGKLHENHPMPCHGRSSFQRAFLPRRWRLRTSFGGLASYAMSAAAQRGAVWLVQDILSDAMTAMCPSPP